MGYICQKEKKLEHVGILRLAGTLRHVEIPRLVGIRREYDDSREHHNAREYYDSWEHYNAREYYNAQGILQRVGTLQRAGILQRVGTLQRAGILRQAHVESVVEEDNKTILRLIDDWSSGEHLIINNRNGLNTGKERSLMSYLIPSFFLNIEEENMEELRSRFME